MIFLKESTPGPKDCTQIKCKITLNLLYPTA